MRSKFKSRSSNISLPDIKDPPDVTNVMGNNHTPIDESHRDLSDSDSDPEMQAILSRRPSTSVARRISMPESKVPSKLAYRIFMANSVADRANNPTLLWVSLALKPAGSNSLKFSMHLQVYHRHVQTVIRPKIITTSIIGHRAQWLIPQFRFSVQARCVRGPSVRKRQTSKYVGFLA